MGLIKGDEPPSPYLLRLKKAMAVKDGQISEAAVCAARLFAIVNSR